MSQSHHVGQHRAHGVTKQELVLAPWDWRDAGNVFDDPSVEEGESHVQLNSGHAEVDHLEEMLPRRSGEPRIHLRPLGGYRDRRLPKVLRDFVINDPWPSSPRLRTLKQGAHSQVRSAPMREQMTRDVQRRLKRGALMQQRTDTRRLKDGGS